MQRASSSIANLAAALSHAQAELVNPEKSLFATIPSDRPGGPERTFRYAPLSAGLEIVRTTLGRHEIAAMQTTAIDQSAGIVNLTTLLAHSSGEWIASDWPVCSISDTATPHRMGAALTYARRYALFTLVGIAGDDDLDAPELDKPTKQPLPPVMPNRGHNTQSNEWLNGGPRHPEARQTVRRYGMVRSVPTQPTLCAEASAELRERLTDEINGLNSADTAATWAYRRLAEKNRLTAVDAQHVEEAFSARVVTFATDVTAMCEIPDASDDPPTLPQADKAKPKKRSRPVMIDKSVLALPEQRRIRDRDHVRYVAKHPCLMCGRQPADAHHLRLGQGRALGRKVSDEFTVPLCRGHHREVHRGGNEAAWWQSVGINPALTARSLWLETHPLARAECGVEEEIPSEADVGISRNNARIDWQVGKPNRNYKTKPNKKKRKS